MRLEKHRVWCETGIVLAVCFGSLGPAIAQTELRPTPEYFAEAVFDMSMAQALARSCATISVDPIRSGARAEALLGQLSDDGFDATAPHEQMDDPDGAIEVLQLAFVERYDLNAPGEEQVCEVAMAEMTAESGIGLLLVEVPG
ncbi:MAG: DUF5333 family protein [Pseudomonadota bacterium]